MNSHTKLGLFVLAILVSFVVFAQTFGKTSQVYKFDFSKTLGLEFPDSPLAGAVKEAMKNSGIKENGVYAIYVEDLTSGGKYGINESLSFPTASLYKLILMAAVLKEVEAGDLKMEDSVSGTKTHLSEVFGGEDFGYADAPENIAYTVDQALTRVGSISDNFAAIMLTEKLRRLRVSRSEENERSFSSNKLLIQMTKDLDMINTDFTSSEGPITTALDVGNYFKRLYKGEVVSKTASEKIINYLAKSKINNRIPAKLPDGVKVVHKTGELARIRHDAGIVYCCKQETPPQGTEAPLESKPYVIVLLSKDLKYEDSGIESLAGISKEIYNYFSYKINKTD